MTSQIIKRSKVQGSIFHIIKKVIKQVDQKKWIRRISQGLLTRKSTLRLLNRDVKETTYFSLDVSNVSANETTDQSPSSSSEDETVAEIRRFFKKHEIVKKLPKHMKELCIVETSADRNINISETFKEKFGKSVSDDFPKFLILRNNRSHETRESPKSLILPNYSFFEIVDFPK